MIALLIALAFIAIVAMTIGYFTNRKGDDIVPVVKQTSDCSSCDGFNNKCEQECMMEAATKEIEYYDDEELDKYKGRTSDSYSDKEAEEFREVLYTMQKDEVKDWNRSLILRGIALPDQLKDELIIILTDERH